MSAVVWVFAGDYRLDTSSLGIRVGMSARMAEGSGEPKGVLLLGILAQEHINEHLDVRRVFEGFTLKRWISIICFCLRSELVREAFYLMLGVKSLANKFSPKRDLARSGSKT
ncbi:MAG: hypothetical protein ACOH2R_05685 [Pseudomonas sp.]